MQKKICFWLFFLTTSYLAHGQSTYVGKNGVFRWSKDKKEIRVFGVNYTLPFAHGYRAITYLDKNHKQAIDKDVYHIARLGLDGFRVHIWDAEVTDSLGNLINSPQLDLLDYTLAKLKERNIKTIITPFKVGGNGYPEKDMDAPGFSNSLQKPQTSSGDDILKKQERYFTQLLNHINPYTKIAYKNDPDIIALEINNEPTHDNGAIATVYINKMIEVIRAAGFKNPIFYNVSERSAFIDDYLKANIQGCTFQWYPTGLVQNQLLNLNFLPNVDQYVIPFADKKALKNKARIIYEFDPGDTNLATLYPAMARSFRLAKFQFAAQFAYDAIDLAFSNTEYQTHYLNLAYTPSKAISLKIANEVFHEVEASDNFDSYPENTTFRNPKLNHNKNLAVYNADTKFFYTNTTETSPKNLKKLQHIAGVGSSSLIEYSGNGAYFLDKVEKGVWRLEVMPNVLWVNDPFEKASLKKTVAVLQENEETIAINLPDLASNFKITAINKDNNFGTKTVNRNFLIAPGTYLLQANDVSKTIDIHQKIGTLVLNEYATTKQEIKQTYLVHHPKNYIEKNENLDIEIQVVSPDKIDKIEVVLPSGYQKTDHYEMIKNGIFSYKTTIPKEKIYNKPFKYYIVVYSNNKIQTFPEHNIGHPFDWDFIGNHFYETTVVENEPTVVLFDAAATNNRFLWPNLWNILDYKIETTSYKTPSKKELHISSTNLLAKNPDITFKILVGDKIKSNIELVNNTKSLVIVASSGSNVSQKVQIALQLQNGKVFGKTIEIFTNNQEISIPFSELEEVPLVLLPRPYPDFQPYFFQSKSKEPFQSSQIEAIQISIGPTLKTEELKNRQELIINKIQLQK